MNLEAGGGQGLEGRGVVGGVEERAWDQDENWLACWWHFQGTGVVSWRVWTVKGGDDVRVSMAPLRVQCSVTVRSAGY